MPVAGRYRSLPLRFFRRPAGVVAPELLGRYLIRDAEGERLVLRIVEVEAYLGAEDRASHAWSGRRTRRTRSLYRDGGVAYVYLIYGMYHCLNVVTGRADDGSAVLIRAGEPIHGVSRMIRNRGLDGSRSDTGASRRVRPGDLAGGPGKVCRALAVDLGFDRAPLTRGRLRVGRGEPITADRIAVGPRVNVDYAGGAAHWPLRFAERGNREVSRPWPWR